MINASSKSKLKSWCRTHVSFLPASMELMIPPHPPTPSIFQFNSRLNHILDMWNGENKTRRCRTCVRVWMYIDMTFVALHSVLEGGVVLRFFFFLLWFQICVVAAHVWKSDTCVYGIYFNSLFIWEPKWAGPKPTLPWAASRYALTSIPKSAIPPNGIFKSPQRNNAYSFYTSHIQLREAGSGLCGRTAHCGEWNPSKTLLATGHELPSLSL